MKSKHGQNESSPITLEDVNIRPYDVTQVDLKEYSGAEKLDDLKKCNIAKGFPSHASEASPEIEAEDRQNESSPITLEDVNIRPCDVTQVDLKEYSGAEKLDDLKKCNIAKRFPSHASEASPEIEAEDRQNESSPITLEDYNIRPCEVTLVDLKEYYDAEKLDDLKKCNIAKGFPSHASEASPEIEAEDRQNESSPITLEDVNIRPCDVTQVDLKEYSGAEKLDDLKKCNIAKRFPSHASEASPEIEAEDRQNESSPITLEDYNIRPCEVTLVDLKEYYDAEKLDDLKKCNIAKGFPNHASEASPEIEAEDRQNESSPITLEDYNIRPCEVTLVDLKEYYDAEKFYELKKCYDAEKFDELEKCNIARSYPSQANEASPLCTIARLTTVTSSGNTIFSFENEQTDPYDFVELSEDEYRPSASEDSTTSEEDPAPPSDSNLSKIKRRLFEVPKDSETIEEKPPLSDSNNSKIKRRLFEAPKDLETIEEEPPPSVSNIIKRRLFEVPKDSESCKSSSKSDRFFREQSPSVGDTLAVVTIKNSKIEIHVLLPIHAGNYAVNLFRRQQPNSNEVYLQGYIMRQKLKDHICVPAQYCGKVAVCDTTRDENRLKCSLDACCPKGYLVGYEKFIAVPVKQFVAILIRNESVVENIEKQVSPLSTPEKTKLKQHCCYFCGELKTCIGRHIQQMHQNEEEVKALNSLKGMEKRKELRRLRLLGDKNYNETVPRQSRIAVRKPTMQLTIDSLHCPSCSALIARRNFSKHHLKCSKRQPDRLKRVHQIEFEEINKKCVDLDQKILQELLRDLQADEVADIIKNDTLIQRLGIYMSKSNRTLHQMKNSKAQMRRCARLLIIMREMDPSIRDFKDCINPKKYSLIMNAIRVLCEQNQASGRLETLGHPTVALQIGPMLSTLISRLRRFYLEEEGLTVASPELQALESFSALHKSEFCVEITRDALNTMNTNKFKSKKELPKPADIQKLREYCKKTFEENYNFLVKEGFDFAKWKRLGEVLLCQIMVFNRRRPGEISRTLLEDYYNKKKVNREQYESLNRLEVICADLFTMIHIKGKRGKTLSILLQPDNMKGLDLFISLRVQAGIPKDNPYLFSYLNKEKYLSASTALKNFTQECGAENPKSLTGTYLRKHAATMCQLFNLNENELKQMADFMGHSFDVHLSHYRMPEQTTQIINISRFLSVVGDKDVFKYRGKSWNELQPFAPPEDNQEEDGDDNSGYPTPVHDEPPTEISSENLIQETALLPVKRRRVVPKKFRGTSALKKYIYPAPPPEDYQEEDNGDVNSGYQSPIDDEPPSDLPNENPVESSENLMQETGRLSVKRRRVVPKKFRGTSALKKYICPAPPPEDYQEEDNGDVNSGYQSPIDDEPPSDLPNENPVESSENLMQETGRLSVMRRRVVPIRFRGTPSPRKCAVRTRSPKKAKKYRRSSLNPPNLQAKLSNRRINLKIKRGR